MNQRLLARLVPAPGTPARVALLGALAEVLPETSYELEGRLDEETPWLVDLPSVDEAERLRAWIEATSPVRVSVVPSFGARAPSRGAAITWLEGRLVEQREREQGELAELHRQREAAAKERARALAAEKKAAPMPVPRPRPISPLPEEATPRPDTPWRQFKRPPTNPHFVLPEAAPRARLWVPIAVLVALAIGAVVAFLLLGG